ncbi:bifunctional hydroxymethylpyrimidine kinase/phosphomethylpyrimidine kinase [Tetragenococcus koreensis]|uniref:bifunctional hydroxymethylpyrimidine kinase/phosphomethylpyrimidine kinase n=1 Tax=Tetragenococcus koreensis TaxID=290335 RepID=UPI001F46134A|nr:bifunctional hydroxymethylpyrimidine kinase/phosphomethylpyrimidine kinase [Tetragenococcus koreensis]MDN5831857.1 bifunctional hydroxymethylpyrimidine kinase/phosphomethylpyrimidine kinase [Tetragenococcus halophilus]MCF1585020.1 bifunctional hydroxymethylpyrimidine kinase/phosphomethylpyrimidine kinase [Tetragenococcus koreensis]MCF1614583.1 bifunctional hydroxymethylpyrimidine kinase/phosphomethylpyrimidine kinase [Tetragenococcus koreensis]MCF1617140.1 bifunctional hydroxymethylpyrimidin
MQTPQVVTIAGSDSGGGAGIQADLKTFQARKVFGMSILVALTAQNTQGVQESLPIPCSFINAQFASLADDFQIQAAKTGMLFDQDHVQAVADNYRNFSFGPLIVDPVMVAKGGHPLLQKEAIQTIKTELVPQAYAITPNLPEAEVLTGSKIRNKEEVSKAAATLQKMGARNVIIKGGHSDGKEATDFVLMEDKSSFQLSAPRIQTKNTHGTGDTFSSCITAELAKNSTFKEAVIIAKKFIQGAIEEGISVGSGHGPTNHWAKLSEEITVKEIVE